ncbi:hypothetical protein RB195_019789 [Necator americanus]|uniref:GPI alpha-1,4-mannosyltransferase I, catalytic subunit n=1 Tax=Necator americanus TaxID=51031 RepID=A0ABR1CI23_NECAM
MHHVRTKVPQRWSRERVLFTALAARFTLVFYSNIHDYIFHVNFTDIDYSVYSDAARHVAEGRSPFARETYRYTPALAWILQPVVTYKDFGKFLFCLFDILVGWMYFEMMSLQRSLTHEKSEKVEGPQTGSKETLEEEVNNSDESIMLPVVIFWLANPLTAIISARGNADVLVCAAVLYTLYLLMKGQWFTAALAHGFLAIHLKIYPLIYFPSIFLHLCQFSPKEGAIAGLKQLLSNWKGFTFAVISLTSFGLVVSFFYYFYGDQFLEEFLLYHIKRRDIKHNFSPYFYPLSLVDDNESLSKIIGFLAFFPQAFLVIFFAFRYYKDLPFCWFLSTFAFVTFNKVCTSQYFVWYIVFLPLIIDRIKMSVRDAVSLILMWSASQGVWLFFAYLFEFQGWHTLELVFAASIGFLLTNIFVMVKIIQAYTCQDELSVKTKED